MKIKEVLATLNNDQLEAIKELTISISKMNFRTKNSNGIINNSNGNWIYGGYYDLGSVIGRCSKGHKIRYCHIAYNTDTQQQIIFGVKCIHDFFEVSEEKQKEIESSFRYSDKILKEIYKMIDSHTNNCEDVQSKLNFIEKYGDISNIQDLQLIKTLLKVKLPVPWQLTQFLNAEYKSSFRKLSNVEFLEKNEELVAAMTLFKFIKDTIDDSQFSWEKRTMESLINNLNVYGKLTDKQVKLFIKLVNQDYTVKDYSNAREKLSKLCKINASFYDKDPIISLRKNLDQNGTLTDRQLVYVDKLFKKYIKQINKLDQ